MESTRVITLRQPVSLASVTYTELLLVEPTFGQLVDCNTAGTPMQQMAALIAAVAKVSPAVVRALCQRDAQDAIDFLDSFGRRTAPPSDTALQGSASSTAGP